MIPMQMVVFSSYSSSFHNPGITEAMCRLFVSCDSGLTAFVFMTAAEGPKILT